MSVYNRKLYNESLYESVDEPIVEVDKLVPEGYQARIYDNELQLQAVLETESFSYEKRKNEANDIEVVVPKNELRQVLPTEGKLYQELAREQTVHLKLANFVQIWKGDKLEASGKITRREIGDDTIQIKAFTEEILFENNRTPANYSEVLSGLDVADIARRVADGWGSKRYATEQQWEQNISTTNIDLETEPGVVMLDDENTSGEIIVRFESAEYFDFKEWERIRWVGDYDTESEAITTIQYRYGEEGNLTDWSDEVGGALTDEIGIVPEATDEPILEVKVNIYPPDGEGNTFFYALETIAKTEFEITLGEIPNSTGLIVSEVDADFTNALKIMEDACDDTDTTFTVQNKELNLYTDFGQNLTDDVLLRKGQNMEIENLSDEDEDIANHVIAYGDELQGESDIDKPYYEIKNEDSIEEFGQYTEILELDVTDQDELEFLAGEELEEKSFPTETFEVQSFEDNEFGLGDKVKVADPETRTIVDAKVDEVIVNFDGSVEKTLNLNRIRRRLIQGVLEPEDITRRKRAQFIISFETTWQEDERPNPFFQEAPSVDDAPSENRFPCMTREQAIQYMAVFDGEMNELDRTDFREVTDLFSDTIGATYFLSVDPGIVEDIEYIGWIGGFRATEETDTGVIIDVRDVDDISSFIPVSKIDVKGW